LTGAIVGFMVVFITGALAGDIVGFIVVMTGAAAGRTVDIVGVITGRGGMTGFVAFEGGEGARIGQRLEQMVSNMFT
jgi:hypothetical protein